MSLTPKGPGEYLLDGIRFPGQRFPESAIRKIQASEFRADDIFIPTFPKSGTHWIKDMVSYLTLNEKFEEAVGVPGIFRAPMIDSDMTKDGFGCMADMFDGMASPRVFASHVPQNIYRKNIENSKCRVMPIMRNPKDVMVSLYHFHRAIDDFGFYEGSWEEFFQHRMTEEGFFGSWFDHVLGYWLPNKNNPNYLFLKYEDFHTDCEMQLRRIATFLKKDISDDMVQKIKEQCSFQKMKKSMEPAINKMKSIRQDISPFYRKGKVGDWKNYFTDAQNEMFDKVYSEKMKGTGLEFQFEI